MQQSGNFSRYTAVLVYLYCEVNSDWRSSGFKPWPPTTSLGTASPELHTGCGPKLCLKVSLGLRSLFPCKQCNKWKLTQGAVPPSLLNPQGSWDWAGSSSILFPLPPPPTPLIPSALHTAMASDLPHFMTQCLKPYLYPRTPYQIKVEFYPLNLSVILMFFFPSSLLWSQSRLWSAAAQTMRTVSQRFSVSHSTCPPLRPNPGVWHVGSFSLGSSPVEKPHLLPHQVTCFCTCSFLYLEFLRHFWSKPNVSSSGECSPTSRKRKPLIPSASDPLLLLRTTHHSRWIINGKVKMTNSHSSFFRSSL